MSESPPPLHKNFSLYEWAALACLLMLPLERTAIRFLSVGNFMFPDVAMVRTLTGSVMTTIMSDWKYAALAAGLFALTGVRPDRRNRRILWMAGAGLIVAFASFAGVRLPF